MPRYALTIAYEGTGFCGWQRQLPHEDSVAGAPLLAREPDLEAPADDTTDTDRPRVELRTVQGVVERAVRGVVREPLHVVGASRTDSGVHARGQVVAFSCSDTGGRTGGWPADRGTVPLMRAINSRLPEDVLVLDARLVDADFDPIFGAERKAYSYTIWNAQTRSLWERRTALHIYDALDVDAMHAAAQRLVGEHDFAGFAAAGHGRKTTVRTVFSCGVRVIEEVGRSGLEELHAERGGTQDSQETQGTLDQVGLSKRIVIDICGSGFLWNMVRIIGGTLVEVGRGRMDASRVDDAIRTGDRRLAGPTLPPHGLCLEWIRYGKRSGEPIRSDEPAIEE